MQQRDKDGGLNPRQCLVMLAVYILSGHNALLAAQYIETTVRKRGMQEIEPRNDLQAVVESMYLRWPLDVLVALESPNTTNENTIYAEAVKFIASTRTVAFVSQMNDQGVAPSTDQMAQQYLHQCTQLGLPGLHPGLQRSMHNALVNQAAGGRKLRLWRARLRANWGLFFGKLKTREPIPQEELVEKAGVV